MRRDGDALHPAGYEIQRGNSVKRSRHVRFRQFEELRCASSCDINQGLQERLNAAAPTFELFIRASLTYLVQGKLPRSSGTVQRDLFKTVPCLAGRTSAAVAVELVKRYG
jgi:hypothetical protein